MKKMNLLTFLVVGLVLLVHDNQYHIVSSGGLLPDDLVYVCIYLEGGDVNILTAQAAIGPLAVTPLAIKF